MTLFFETYSIIQTLFLFRYIKKAKIIYFYRKAFPVIIINPQIKRIVIKLIRLFNKNIEIKTPYAGKINEYNWIMNKKAVELVNGLTVNVKNSSIYKSILKIICDENILKCYKKQIVDDVSAKLLFFKIGKELIKDYRDGIYLIPADNDNSGIQNALFGNEVLNSHILPASFIANQVRNLFNRTYALIIFFLLPSAYIILNLKKITLKKINKKRYDIIMPVMWGFYEGEAIIDGVKWGLDDNYLYNEEIKLGHIIHVFKYWRFSSEVEKNYKNVMAKRGIPFIDSKDFRMNIKFVFTAAKIQLRIAQYFFNNIFHWKDRCEYINYSHKIIHRMLNKQLDFENIDFKVEFMRNDYDVGHIVTTILCNRYGKKTIGVQHGSTAGPYVFPSLCYVHFDKYCVFSDRHIELHAPLWNRCNLAKTGNYRIDQLIEISKNQSLMTSIKNNIAALYGNKKYIVVILFPSPSEYNTTERFDMIYEALHELKLIEIDCNIFLRFKRKMYLENSHLRRFKNLPQIDNRFIIDLINFSSYELIAVSDMLITSSHSSGMIDAVSIGKKAFTFDYMGTAKHCFGKYGKDIVLNKKEDVLNLFQNLENNFAGYDCNWDLLRKEYNYHYDGKSLRRLQQVVLETVQEVS